MANEAQVKLGVSTSQVIAELNTVIAKAREAHSLTQGLPPSGMRTAQSPRLPSIPSADVGGGKAGDLRSNLNRTPVESGANTLLGAKAATSHGSPRSAMQASTISAMTQGPTTPSLAAVSNATGAAAAIAQAQGTERLMAKMQKIGFERGGLVAGPLQFNANGLGLMAAAQALGPAAGYAGVAIGAMKTINGALSIERAAIAEAARTGENPYVVAAKMGMHSALNSLADVSETVQSVLGVFRDAALGLGESNLNNNLLGWMSPIGTAVGVGARIAGKDARWLHDKNTASREWLDDKMRGARGQMSNSDTRRIGLMDATTKWIADLDRIEEHTATMASRTARQLWGMGFGSREEIEKLVVDAQELKAGVSRDRIRQLVQQGFELDGKQE